MIRKGLLPVVLLAWLPALVGTLQGQDCTSCHDGSAAAASVHAAFGCAGCHSNIDGFPHPESALQALPESEICAQCHAAGAEVAGSVHADLLECGACHGPPHELLAVDDLSSPVSPLKQIQVCAQCHDSDGLIEHYLDSSHGRALVVSGLINAPSCSDCHGSHAVLGPAEPDSRVAARHVPETCGSCHRYILEAWVGESAHGARWRASESGPVCTTCHTSHSVAPPMTGDQRLKFPEECGGCHEDQYVSYRDSFHGRVTDLGFLTAAICSDCHSPHRNLAAADPRSTVHSANIGETCGRCHADVNSSFLTFDPHNDPTDPGDNIGVFWVWVLMTALLIATFGFFGVHDLLWLQRSAVAWLRGELAGVRSDNGPYVRRFDTVHIWLHASIIASFLLLAATGLPLKFHDSAWAAGLASLMGGVGMTRLLHRLAAIVTFCYALYHLGYLFRHIVLGRDLHLLRDWRSMMPRRKDLDDFLKNLRYFLYRGPRPELDRWTYWEKFDYFAVFWGVLIIGSSGLLLWFPAFFTRLLPGWTLNAALVIHSDEALLAVGFIFVFHFFHTHLRPESFPLDPVIFTGLVPLERFKEERPVEYRRLLAAGELDGMLVHDGPSRRERRRAYGLGVAALGVGLSLIGLILWAFLGPLVTG